MARVLIVGCGCRGRELAAELTAAGHAVRGTTRREKALEAISATGAEAVLADPARLATILPRIEGVSVVCWLVRGGPLETLLERLVDTPVRGFVYEGDRPDVVRAASDRWQIPVEVIDEDPVDHPAWRATAAGAVSRLLGG
ncbi:MAG: hypothetical protein ACJ766_17025 [Thermoleophilaceae bacterium]